MNPATGVTSARSAPLHGQPAPVPIRERDRRIADVLPAVVRQVPVGVGVARRDRSIAYFNDELARILRLPEGETSTSVPLPVLRRADGAPFPGGEEPLDRVFRTRLPTARHGVVVVREDGSRSDVSITTTPIVEESGEVVGVIIYMEDMTEDLEDLSLREAFVGVLSHELRTPITSIYGGTQLLLHDRMPADVRSTVINDIAAEAEQLHRLVEDLLAIARIERGLTEAGTEPVLLQRLATEAAAAEERRWPGHRVEVHADIDLAAARADEGYAVQILRNLISNAVKYSPMNRAVVVTLSQVDDEIRVCVLDRGPGFPPETGDDAFRLFYRSPAVAARVPGTGIGLFVARALVEAQGGRIWLRNRPDGGAEVGFALPLYTSDEIE